VPPKNILVAPIQLDMDEVANDNITFSYLEQQLVSYFYLDSALLSHQYHFLLLLMVLIHLGTFKLTIYD
jgi:hypothetical protein